MDQTVTTVKTYTRRHLKNCARNTFPEINLVAIALLRIIRAHHSDSLRLLTDAVDTIE